MKVKKKESHQWENPTNLLQIQPQKIYVVVEEAPWFCTHGTGLQRAIDSRLVVGFI